MNNFLFEERMAEEYRHEKMTEAQERNKHAHLYTSKATIFAYKSLAYFGKTLEGTGCKMRARYEALALQEKGNALPEPVK
ncbi:MAG: hypothetical protein GY755_19115 [Chloroflexi bacterium]|nr:hypothetical protein [Chloroflexota bacterium]